MTEWNVIPSPTDSEMYAVQGVYLVADRLPIEDAQMIAAAPEMLNELRAIRHQVQVDTGHFNRLQRLIESIEQQPRDRDIV